MTTSLFRHPLSPTSFEYKKKNSGKVEKDTFTQFSYACKQLGVEIKTTSIPQAKGRVERAFQTLQQRLPIALRLAGIQELSAANAFLDSYLEKYNTKFTLPINHNKSVFEKQPDLQTINQTLAVLADRVVDSGHCIQFQNQYFRLMDAQGYPVYFHKGTKGLVIQTFDKQLYYSINDTLYELENIPIHERSSKSFDIKPFEDKPKKRNIPPAKHPWRSKTFWEHRSHTLSVTIPFS